MDPFSLLCGSFFFFAPCIVLLVIGIIAIFVFRQFSGPSEKKLPTLTKHEIDLYLNDNRFES